MSPSLQNEPAQTQATDPQTEQFLDEFRDYEAVATPGPWGSVRGLSGVYTMQARPRVIPGVGMGSDGDVAVVCPAGSDAETYANARFIAMAREAPRALLAEVDRQAREIERLTAEVALWKGAEEKLISQRDDIELTVIGCEKGKVTADSALRAIDQIIQGGAR